MIPWFQFTVVHLGPIPIRVWGFFVALGMVVALLIIRKRAEKKSAEMMLDLAVWMISGGLLGARLFHVLFYEPGFYFTNPLEILKVWQGGLSSFGGLFGAMAGYWLYFKKNNLEFKIYNLKFADAMAFAAVYGWLVGRLGCVMIHDHPGRPSQSWLALRWPDGPPRFDMALLEILGLVPLAIWFYLKNKKNKNPSPSRGGEGGVSQTPDGWYLHILFIYYGLLRFILDFFRATDLPGADARYLGLTPAQYFAILLVIAGARFFISAKRHEGRVARRR